MGRWILIVLAFAIAAVVFWMTRTDLLFGDVEAKGGVSEMTEWIKLAISVVGLLIGLVNLRIALAKEKSG